MTTQPYAPTAAEFTPAMLPDMLPLPGERISAEEIHTGDVIAVSSFDDHHGSGALYTVTGRVHRIVTSTLDGVTISTESGDRLLQYRPFDGLPDTTTVHRLRMSPLAAPNPATDPDPADAPRQQLDEVLTAIADLGHSLTAFAERLLKDRA